jgi:alkylation response protein AidB-like acyl-CoA dehydrogenase
MTGQHEVEDGASAAKRGVQRLPTSWIVSSYHCLPNIRFGRMFNPSPVIHCRAWQRNIKHGTRMDFNLTQEQEILQQTVESFVQKESPPSRLRKLREDDLGYSKALWKKMADLGWLGICFPEERGGYGGDFLDATLLLEQFGTTLVPEPFIPSVILAGMTIAWKGTPAQRMKYLEPMITGDTTLAFAYAEDVSRFEVTHVSTRATVKDGKKVANGKKVFVLNGHAADFIIVSVRESGNDEDRDGLSLYVLERNTPGLRIQPLKMMDGHRGAHLILEDVELTDEARLGEVGGAASELEHTLDRGAAAACAEGLGLMKTVLTMTCEYLGTREQFGVKIGSFQALQHRAVEMFVEVELSKGTAILAALKIGAAGEERTAAISAAKAQLALGGRFVTQQSIQLHGGIGITDEHDIGLYFKRMHSLNTLFGDEEFHTKRYGSLSSFLSY